MKLKALLALAALFGATAMAQDKWTVEATTDDFDGTRRTIAMSPTAYGSPYRASGVVARCENGTDLRVFLWFDYLNSSNDYNLGTGERVTPIKIKFGNRKPTSVGAFPNSSRKALFLGYIRTIDLELAKELMAARTFMARIDYFAHGAATIKYNMAGSKEAIGKVLQACGIELVPEPSTETATD